MRSPGSTHTTPWWWPATWGMWRRCAFALPAGWRVWPGYGRDGADRSLLESAPADWVVERFDRLVIGSGDHAFRPLATAAANAGLTVTVVGRCETVARRLAMAADTVIDLRRPSPILSRTGRLRNHTDVLCHTPATSWSPGHPPEARHHPPTFPREESTMHRERRERLEALMQRMADGDLAAVITFQDEFADRLRGVVRTVLRDLHREDVMASPGEVDGLVCDATFVLFDHAAGWRPDGGALPWVWAQRAIRAQIVRAIGHPVGGTEEDLESEAGAAAPIGGADLSHEAVRDLAATNAVVALLIELLDHTLDARHVAIVLDYQLLKAAGCPDASGTVASLYDTSASNVRQIRRRAMQKLAPALATPQYAPIAHLHLLTA